MDTTYISDAKTRNFTRWDYHIGYQIWIEPQPIPETYAEEIDVLKSWISDRLNWLDANVPGDCSNDILTSSLNLEIRPKKVVRTIDLFGREINIKNQPHIHIYDDGTVEKKLIIE